VVKEIGEKIAETPIKWYKYAYAYQNRNI